MRRYILFVLWVGGVLITGPLFSVLPSQQQMYEASIEDVSIPSGESPDWQDAAELPPETAPDLQTVGQAFASAREFLRMKMITTRGGVYGFGCVPEEITAHVFHFLDQDSLVRAGRVSRSWWGLSRRMLAGRGLSLDFTVPRFYRDRTGKNLESACFFLERMAPVLKKLSLGPVLTEDQLSVCIPDGMKALLLKDAVSFPALAYFELPLCSNISLQELSRLLSKMPHLNHLGMPGMEREQLPYDAIARLTELNSLSLNCFLSDAQLIRMLGGRTTFTAIDVGLEGGVSSEAAALIASFPKLKKLVLLEGSTANENRSVLLKGLLGSLRQLQVLHVSNFWDPESLSLKELRELRLETHALPGDSVKALGRELTNLRSLTLGALFEEAGPRAPGSGDAACLEVLKFPYLSALNIAGNALSSEGLENGCTKNLRRLDLARNPVEDGGVGLLMSAGPLGLEELNLCDTGITDAALFYLVGTSPEHPERSCVEKSAPALRCLDISLNPVTASGISALQALGSLSHLRASDCALTDDATQALLKFQGLTSVMLSMNRLTDFAPFGQLEGLQVLDLQFNGHLSAVMETLREPTCVDNLQALRELSLPEQPENAKVLLENTLPHCKLEFSPDPEGWA